MKILDILERLKEINQHHKDMLIKRNEGLKSV